MSKLLLLFPLLLSGCAHQAKERAVEPVGTIQRSDQDFFAGDPATRVACKGDADCPSGALCHPGQLTCFSSYPDPRKLNVTLVAGRDVQVAARECALARLYFPFDSAALVPEAEQWLGYNTDCLKSRRPGRVIIEAHADARGATRYNVELSRKRGEAVRERLRARGVNATIEVMPLGEAAPSRPGMSEKDFAYNRRVEFRID